MLAVCASLGACAADSSDPTTSQPVLDVYAPGVRLGDRVGEQTTVAGRSVTLTFDTYIGFNDSIGDARHGFTRILVNRGASTWMTPRTDRPRIDAVTVFGFDAEGADSAGQLISRLLGEQPTLSCYTSERGRWTLMEWRPGADHVSLALRESSRPAVDRDHAAMITIGRERDDLFDRTGLFVRTLGPCGVTPQNSVR